MGRLGRAWKRLTNRDLIEQSEREKEEFVRTETRGRLELLRYLERRSTEHAAELTEHGFSGRASAEDVNAREAREEARALRGHTRTYGADPLLDLLGGPAGLGGDE